MLYGANNARYVTKYIELTRGADDDDEVGAPATEHAEGGLGGEVERDPANKTLEGEPASSGGEQPGDGKAASC